MAIITNHHNTKNISLKSPVNVFWVLVDMMMMMIMIHRVNMGEKFFFQQRKKSVYRPIK